MLVQSKVKGGSLHAARAAIAQRRSLGVWLPDSSREDPDWGGNRATLESSRAAILRTAEDTRAFVAECAAAGSLGMVAEPIVREQELDFGDMHTE